MAFDYAALCRDAFALVEDIGNGSFNTEFSERGTMATTVEVAMPVLAIFRTLDPDDPESLAKGQAQLARLAEAEQGVFSRYPTLAEFALGAPITVQ